MSDIQHTRDDRHRAKVFDIRVFIAALIGSYGVVLVLTGLFGTNEADLAMAGGVNVNLLAGLGMVVFSGCFMAWARLRPVLVPERPEEHADPETAEVK